MGILTHCRFFKRLKLDYPTADTTRGSRRFVKSMKQLEVGVANTLVTRTQLTVTGRHPPNQHFLPELPGLAPQNLRVRPGTAHHSEAGSGPPMAQGDGRARRRHRGGQDSTGKETHGAGSQPTARTLRGMRRPRTTTITTTKYNMRQYICGQRGADESRQRWATRLHQEWLGLCTLADCLLSQR